jgi:hypothetical protein
MSVFIAIYIVGVLASYAITKIVFKKTNKINTPKSFTEKATEEYALALLTVLSFFGIFCLLVCLLASVTFKYLDKKLNLNE